MLTSPSISVVKNLTFFLICLNFQDCSKLGDFNLSTVCKKVLLTNATPIRFWIIADQWSLTREIISSFHLLLTECTFHFRCCFLLISIPKCKLIKRYFTDQSFVPPIVWINFDAFFHFFSTIFLFSNAYFWVSFVLSFF